jgi:hypothetical protein
VQLAVKIVLSQFVKEMQLDVAHAASATETVCSQLQGCAQAVPQTNISIAIKRIAFMMCSLSKIGLSAAGSAAL